MSSISTMARVADHVSRSQSDQLVVPPLISKGNLMDRSEPHYENGLFSSSLSDMFDRKLRLSSSIVPLDQSINSINSNSGEDEPFESMEEIEAQTIGNLLPDDDDDLVSGVIDNIGYIGRPSTGNDIDDDIFYSSGGMELESDDNINGNRTSESVWGGISTGQQEEPNGPFAGEHPYGEHPSRTLFVRNINSNVEDGELQALFEQYGDILMLYTTCKHCGFVMISYYDIRAARNAMRALQNKPLRRRKLDIHFSIPKTVRSRNPPNLFSRAKDLQESTPLPYLFASHDDDDDDGGDGFDLEKETEAEERAELFKDCFLLFVISAGVPFLLLPPIYMPFPHCRFRNGEQPRRSIWR